MRTTMNTAKEASFPRIPLDLRQHKLAIGIPWLIIITTAGILPLVGYFTVHYCTNASLTVQLSPFLATFGVSTLYNLFTRTRSLLRKDSTTRPVGQTSRWAMDYFEWNLLFGFVGLTILIALAIALELVRVASLPLSVILLYACSELLLGALGHALKLKCPFRISSTARGERVRSGVLAIAEDIVAVDGKQGTAFRQLLIARYDASPPIQRLCFKLDLMWGFCGLAVVAAVAGVAFGVDNSSYGYGLGTWAWGAYNADADLLSGWGLPWVYAIVLTLVTISMVKAAKREENLYARSVENGA